MIFEGKVDEADVDKLIIVMPLEVNLAAIQGQKLDAKFKDVYEYIRYPFSWNLLNKSITNLFEFCQNNNLFFLEKKIPPKALIGFSIVAQPYNIFNLGEIYRWASNFYEKY